MNDRRWDIATLTIEEESQYTIFGGQTLYKIKYKGNILIASVDKNEIENWLHKHTRMSDKSHKALATVPKTLAESLARAYATRTNRHT